MRQLFSRWLDLRPGEARTVAGVFAILFLVVGGYTMVETARDALFLSRLPPRQLNVVYIVIAGLSFVVAPAMSLLNRRMGRRPTLVFVLGVACFATLAFWFSPPTQRVVFALYVFGGFTGTTLTVQFWSLCASMFTVGQGRRIFAPIASGGVAGALAGAATGAAVLMSLPVKTLLPCASAAFAMAAAVTLTLRIDDVPATERAPSNSLIPPGGSGLFRENPFLLRIAALVVISTASLLALDYAFKASAAHAIPAAQLGSFFARYYAVTNGFALVAQIFFAGRLIRRVGVVGATGVMPFFLLAGAMTSLVFGGGLPIMLLTKAVDGTLRYSLNRVALEILYLPVPAEARDRGKALLDAVVVRIVQALTAASLLALAGAGLARPRILAGLIALLCLGWLGVASRLRRPYLDLFRRALAAGAISRSPAVAELDVTSAEALVEALASPEPGHVIAAIEFMASRRRGRLLPALILHHDDPAVLVRALELFGDSARRDWMGLAERLLHHPNEAVRLACVRAFAKHSSTAILTRALDDVSSQVHAYAALQLAMRASQEDIAENPLIAAIMQATGEAGDAGRRSLLEAIVDSPDPRTGNVLFAFATGRIQPPQSDPNGSDDVLNEFGRRVAAAIRKLNDPRFIQPTLARLGRRDSRDFARSTLAALGIPALDALERALADSRTPRRVRLHVPRAIAEFPMQRACDVLTSAVEAEKDGALRFRTLRALGHLVSTAPVKTDRRRMERLARAALVEHLRVTALKIPLATPPAVGSPSPSARLHPGTAHSLIVDLLDDKAVQALERAFRFLQIAHKREDLRRVYGTFLHGTKNARANAAEFVDTLLWRHDERELRELLRTAVDDLAPNDRIARASSWLASAPTTFEESLGQLLAEQDAALAVLAMSLASSLEDPRIGERIKQATQERPSLRVEGQRMFGNPSQLGVRNA